MTFLGQARSVAAKDLRIEVRGRYGIGVVLPFAATLLIAFGLSLGPGRTLLRDTAPGLLWLSMLFASVLAFRRSYESEGEDGALEGLLLSPVDKAAVFLGKAAAVAVQLVVLEVLVVLLVAGLFGLSLAERPVQLAGALVLGGAVGEARAQFGFGRGGGGGGGAGGMMGGGGGFGGMMGGGGGGGMMRGGVMRSWRWMQNETDAFNDDVQLKPNFGISFRLGFSNPGS